ncbi:glycosyltransferase family 2 protein [Helicobacter sp. T3_23-1056]
MGGGNRPFRHCGAHEHSECNEAVHKNKMDCHESLRDSRNDGILNLHSVSTQGKGAVIADAFALIEADIYIMIDADLQYDISILPRALQIFKEQNLDMLNIARMPIDSTIHRKGHSFGNALFTKIAQILFGVSLKDLLSGYRIFSRAFVKTFPATSKGFEIETELSVFALQSGLRIGEITAPYRSRVAGSFSKLRTFRDGFKILSMIMQLLFTERPLFVFGIASALCFIVAFALGVPLVVEFIQTSKVPRFPTAFICVGFGVVGVVLGIAGLLAHLVVRGIRENRRFFYLANKGADSSLRGDLSPKQSKPFSSLRGRQPEAIHESNIDCHESLCDSRNDKQN